MFRALGLPAKVVDAAACAWLEWRSRRMIREVDPFFALLRQSENDAPDVWVLTEDVGCVCERVR